MIMQRRLLFALLLLAYGAMLIKVMVFKDLPAIRIGHYMLNLGGTRTGPPNFVPFRSLLPYLLGRRGGVMGLINVVGNIVLLMPVGYLFALVFREMRLGHSIGLGLMCGFVLEGMEAVFRVGIFDVDDILLNGLGVVLGFLVFARRKYVIL